MTIATTQFWKIRLFGKKAQVLYACATEKLQKGRKKRNANEANKCIDQSNNNSSLKKDSRVGSLKKRLLESILFSTKIVRTGPSFSSLCSRLGSSLLQSRSERRAKSGRTIWESNTSCRPGSSCAAGMECVFTRNRIIDNSKAIATLPGLPVSYQGLLAGLARQSLLKWSPFTPTPMGPGEIVAVSREWWVAPLNA